MADSDLGKLFVGGISRETSDVTLRDHFSKYGDVSFSVIAKDRLTGLPRGFGFITFSNPSSVDNALLDPYQLINGRTVEVKRAIPRTEQQQPQQQQQQQQQHQPLLSNHHSQTTKALGRNNNNVYGASNCNPILKVKKIFVGGLSDDVTEEEFKSYFEKFGTVTDAVVMYDNNTSRPRGFGFITFESEDVFEKIIQKSYHELAGKRVEVKRAVPREATRNLSNGSISRSDDGRYVHETGNNTPNGSYLPRGPTHGTLPGQLPVSTPYPGYYYNNGCLYSGGYPMGGGYGFFGYGMPIVSFGSPLSGSPLSGSPYPVNYGTGYYPTGVNAGFPMMGMVSPYGGFMDPRANGTANHHGFRSNVQMHHRDLTPPTNGSRSDANGSILKAGKQDLKSPRISEVQAQFKVPHANESS